MRSAAPSPTQTNGRTPGSPTALGPPRARASADSPSTSQSERPSGRAAGEAVRPQSDVALECGWGRLVFGQTFSRHADLLATLAREAPGRRDVCMYVPDPQVLVSMAPTELFLDPSVTYRRTFGAGRPVEPGDAPGVVVRPMSGMADADEINRLYVACGMLTAPTRTLVTNQRGPVFTYLVAADADSGRVLGSVTGVDHVAAFGDPTRGSSLWCLCVDPQSRRPGVGESLVRALLARAEAAGSAYLDLSVLHDNAPAIALYEKLGFERVPEFCVKRKNSINERLFTAGLAHDLDQLNPYARIIADEALRRGIDVEVLDAEWGELRLTHGGRTVVTRESLSELTSAVAMSRCDDKRVTRRILASAGLRVPRGRTASGGPEPDEADCAFLAAVGSVVVKPARGEQGHGVSVGVRTRHELAEAIALARGGGGHVLLEEMIPGEDLRVLLIDHQVVAAAVRRPAEVVGSGRQTVAELIEAQSRRRAAATGGESRIPVDDATRRVVAQAGHRMDDVLPEGETLPVRRTANLHTGGTIHDVTADLHPELVAVAEKASRVLETPVVGLDFLVPAPDSPDYHFIEANERPGLANHEPQPTAARFLDLLFPATRAVPQAWAPPGEGGHA
jgi:GNAT-family acetyltransferase (TIGR03103 family)